MAPNRDADQAAVLPDPGPISAAARRSPRHASAERFAERIKWETLARVVALTLLLFFGVAMDLGFGPQPIAQLPEVVLYKLITTFYVLSFVALLATYLVGAETRRLLAWASLCIDMSLAATLVTITHGTESVFLFTLPLTVLSGAALLERPGAVVAASAGAVLLSVLALIDVRVLDVDLEVVTVAWLRALGPRGVPATFEVIVQGLVQVAALYATAMLSSQLVVELNRARQRSVLERQELTALRVRYEDVWSSLPEGLATVSQDGVIRTANPALLRILDLSAAQLVGRPVNAVLPELTALTAAGSTTVEIARSDVDATSEIRRHRGQTGKMTRVAPSTTDAADRPDAAETPVSPDAEAAGDVAAAFMATGSTASGSPDARSATTSTTDLGEVAAQDGDNGGGLQILTVRSELLRDTGSQGRLTGETLLVVRDVTRMRRREQAHLNRERLATVGAMAMAIAHEIRNPLASISGAVQMLEATLKVDEDERSLMQIAVRETQQLSDWIGEFLDYAKPGNLHLEPIQLADLVREKVAALQQDPRVAAAGVQVQLALTTDGATLLGDYRSLNSLVWNLLRNAVDAVLEAERREVHVGVDALHDSLVLRVSDSGSGVPESDRAQLFEPFFTTRAEGTGLGLATVRRVVDNQRGDIVVRDSELGGALFVVTLPKDLHSVDPHGA